MSYTALYRKWRPQRFEDVRGQDHIVKTLKNQILAGRIGHAYLFTGTRGTGKTTVAKIFARAVNCEKPISASPCNECATCRAIFNGTSVNVVEIDAASNNGVENIREIREEVKYRPTEGKYRVYIIDEAHMITSAAWNALLKTLEEPPEYVIFIFATTEVQKIPITILSRCQRYDFKRLTLAEIENQINDVLEKEGIEADERAVSYLARQADGSSRDALSLLEQCISFGPGEKLTYERALEYLGAVDQSVFSEMFRKIRTYDVQGAIAKTDEMLSSGRELSQFVADFIWYLRNILLLQTGDPSEDALGISKENLLEMKAEAGEVDIPCVMRYIRILSQLTNEMRYSSSKRVLFELALLKMMRPETEENEEGILSRLRALEDRMANLSSGFVPNRDDAEIKKAAPATPTIQREVEVPLATYEDYQKISADWEDSISDMSGLIRSLLQGTKVSADENGRVMILFRNAFNYNMMDKSDRPRAVEKFLSEKYGKQISIGLTCLAENEREPKIKAITSIPGVNMEITEV